jgi:RNA-binding protein
MLTPSQRQELKGHAHGLKPIVILGEKGLGPTVLAEIDRALRVHELIKIRAGGEDRDERGAAMATICKELNAHPVQIIGKLLVVYRAMTQEEREERVKLQTQRKKRVAQTRRIKEAREERAKEAAVPRTRRDEAAAERARRTPSSLRTSRERIRTSPVYDPNRGVKGDTPGRKTFGRTSEPTPARPTTRTASPRTSSTRTGTGTGAPRRAPSTGGARSTSPAGGSRPPRKFSRD